MLERIKAWLGLGVLVASMVSGCACGEERAGREGAEQRSGGAGAQMQPEEALGERLARRKASSEANATKRAGRTALSWSRVRLPGRGRRVLESAWVTGVVAKDKRVVATTRGKGLVWSQDGGGAWTRETRFDTRATAKAGEEVLGSDALGGVVLSGERAWVFAPRGGFGARAWEGGVWRWWDERAWGAGGDGEGTSVFADGATLTVTMRGGVQRTLDGGVTWLPIEVPGPARVSGALAYARAGAETGPRVQGEWFAHEGGVVHVWPDGQVFSSTEGDGLPVGPVLGVQVTPYRVFVRTARGVAATLDGGATWELVGTDEGLPDAHALAMTMWDGSLWVGTARGLAEVSPRRLRVRGVSRAPTAKAWRGQVTALSPTADGEGLWVGTAAGLWRVERGAPKANDARDQDACRARPNATPRPEALGALAKWVRPVEGAAAMDRAEAYGAPIDDEGHGREGVVFEVPLGAKAVAVTEGEVVQVKAPKRVGKPPAPVDGEVVVRAAAAWQGRDVFAVYRGLERVDVAKGARVRAGQALGSVGARAGRGARLVWEVRIGARGIRGGNGRGVAPIDAMAWLRPLEGTGAVAGVITSSKAGYALPGVRLVGLLGPQPMRAPLGAAVTFARKARGVPGIGENAWVPDVLPGTYAVEATVLGRSVEGCVTVRAGEVAWVSWTL